MSRLMSEDARDDEAGVAGGAAARPRAPHELLRDGIVAQRAGDLASARALVRAVIEAEPLSEIGWHWFASVAETRDEQAVALRRVLELNPENASARVSLDRVLLHQGVAAARAGRKAEARRFLEEVAASDSQNVVCWLWLASVARDAWEAERFLEKVLLLEPGHANATAWLARLRARPSEVPPPEETTSPLASPPDRGAVAIAAPAPVPARTEPEPPVAAPRTKGRILVVDDSPTVRRLVSQTLERNGFAVSTAADGLQALAHLQETVPDVVFLDVVMPHLDGLKLCGLIRRNERLAKVPVVMLSARDGAVDRLKGAAAGASDYLGKPFLPDLLIRTAEDFASSGSRPR